MDVLGGLPPAQARIGSLDGMMLLLSRPLLSTSPLTLELFLVFSDSPWPRVLMAAEKKSLPREDLLFVNYKTLCNSSFFLILYVSANKEPDLLLQSFLENSFEAAFVHLFIILPGGISIWSSETSTCFQLDHIRYGTLQKMLHIHHVLGVF